MKTKILSFFTVQLTLIFCCFAAFAQQPAPNWNQSQLTEPAALAKTLQSKKDIPVIYSVGPGAIIPHSLDMGMANDSANLQLFKQAVSKLPRNTNIVVYCGCCPFDHCPNVRPAIDVLQKMKFTNYHLLNLPNNIKTDWIAKGYPVMEESK